jgi:serine phosphatase RsbU (regulator of sigma subunit)
LNGAEVALAAGFPLGLSLETRYEESQFFAEIASTLTFISDGIVEARSATGELFGFDRTAHISNAGAEAIAQAALSFGQDDDITVLTLTRIPVQDEIAAELPIPAILFSKA